MKWSYSPYELIVRQALNSQKTDKVSHGVLLKLEDSGHFGFSLLHSWPQFGQDSVPVLLEKLRQGRSSEILQQSTTFAQKDLTARAGRTSLWQDLKIPQSHYNLGNIQKVTAETIKELIGSGFEVFKLKMNSQVDDGVLSWVELAKLLPESLRWRWDYNSSADFSELIKSWRKIPENLKAQIEFVEDPCPFVKDHWQALAEILPLACDWEFDSWAKTHPGGKSFIKTLVLKPHYQNVEKLVEKYLESYQQVVVTSAQDHPVGQCLAAVWAGGLKQRKVPVGVCGLNSHWSFQENSFSEKWKRPTPEFEMPQGFGFGFAAELEKINWRPL